MKEFVILGIIFWVPLAISLFKNIFYQLYLWQIKEYRLDRFVNHLVWEKEDHSGWKLGIKFILFALTTLVFSVPLLASIAVLLTFILFVNEPINFIQSYFTNRLARPSLKSPRNLLIIFFFLLIILLFYIVITYPFFTFNDRAGDISGYTSSLFSNFNDFIAYERFPDIYLYLTFSTMIGLFLDIATPLIVTFLVFLTSPLAFVRRELTILKARAKYNRLKDDLIIIAITGSQGKTTMKEMIYALIEDDFDVVKTPENYNTDFGVADSFLRYVTEDTEVFIAEVGAYKKGEIEKVCKAFPPDISVITDIDVQHIGLFGGRRKVFEAKSEILKFMKEGGISIINGDNFYAKDLLALTKGEAYVAFSDEKKGERFTKENLGLSVQTVIASNITETSKLSFDVNYNNEQDFNITYFNKGQHLTNLLLLSIATLKALKYNNQDIIKHIRNLEIKLPRLSIETGDNETLIINDSYNSTPKGFVAAVAVMNAIKKGKYEDIKLNKKGKRIIVSKGILELGKHKEEIYLEMLEKFKNKFDILITTDSMLANLAYKDNINAEIIKVKNEAMLEKIREVTSPNDIILLEGRLHPSILKNLVSDNA